MNATRNSLSPGFRDGAVRMDKVRWTRLLGQFGGKVKLIPTSLKRGTKSRTVSNVTPAIRSASSRLYGPRYARAGCNPVNRDFLSFCEWGSLAEYERIKRCPLTLSFDLDRYSRFAACSFDRRKQHRWLDLRGGAPLQLKNSGAPPHLFRALQPSVHLRY